MNLTVDKLFAIIGEQHVELLLLKQQLAAAQQELLKLKKAEEPKA